MLKSHFKIICIILFFVIQFMVYLYIYQIQRKRSLCLPCMNFFANLKLNYPLSSFSTLRVFVQYLLCIPHRPCSLRIRDESHLDHHGFIWPKIKPLIMKTNSCYKTFTSLHSKINNSLLFNTVGKH